MSPWYSSWLPGFPSINIALPSSLQGRFVSFVLKKSLGHLLRPGQLDSRQIDSQIGSGFVQVNDLELNNEAINALLSDFPIVFHDGFISSVVARIPWPNPLTSTLGFSLDSLNLTFHLVSPPANPTHETSSLADSVAFAAESFIHDELTPEEGAALKESVHPNLAAVQSDNGPSVPGELDLDPFLSLPEEVHHYDMDPAGVSIFATLIERLLARFEFDAVNTKVTLVHPGNMSVTAFISDIRYRTEDGGDSDPSTAQRTVSITGVTLSARNLRPPLCSLSSDSPLSSSPNEEMMQSLAFLPPKQSSPASSATSSMYQSAISIPSTSKGSPNNSRSPSPTFQAEQQTVLSFGSSPITIQLTTRSQNLARSPRTENLQFHVTLGVVTCALCAWHVRGVLDMLTIWSTHSEVSAHSTSSDSNTPSLGLEIIAGLEVRGIVLIIPLPSSSGELAQNFSAGSLLADFFNQPFIPPLLPCSYLRLYLEGITASVISTSATDEFSQRRGFEGVSLPTSAKSLSANLSLNEVSLFSLYTISTPSSTSISKLFASPILLVDHALPSQYSSAHFHPEQDELRPPLPSFPVMNWTDEKYHSHGLKPTLWRYKNHHKQSRGRYGPPPGTPYLGIMDSPSATSQPAITITVKKRLSPSLPSHYRESLEDGIEIQIAPLHFFIDFGKALKINAILIFLDEVLGGSERAYRQETPHFEPAEASDYRDSNPDKVITPSASPERQKDRRRLQKLVFDDPDLSLDYVIKQPIGETIPGKRLARKQKSGIIISVTFNMVRLQIRCSPPSRHSPRSGSLVFDLHGINFTNVPVPLKHDTRFANTHPPQVLEEPGTHSGVFLFGAEFKSIIVACSPVHEHSARSLVSMGSLDTRSDAQDDYSIPRFGSDTTPTSSLQPRISVTKSTLISEPSSAVMVLSFDIPSINVDIPKDILDSLQYWADDLAQLIQDPSSGDNSSRRTEKRDASMIGSGFFARSRSGSTLSTGPDNTRYKTVVKCSISEAFIKAMVPRAEDTIVYPFMVSASDVDISFELKPEGKDESVVTLRIMNLSASSKPAPHITQTLLSLTSPRGLSSVPKPMVKLRFKSLVVPETTAKESKINLILSGFTFTLFPDLQWTSDLAAFIKSPPGTFESVIPSERTHISLKILDGSIRALAPHYPGAIVIHISESDFLTDLVGGSPDSSFRLSVPALGFLAIDDVSDSEDDKRFRHDGISFWTGAGFALLAEITDLTLNLKHRNDIKPPSIYVVIDRASLNVHLCADSLGAVSAFANDLGSIFKPIGEERMQKSKRPSVVSTQPSASLMASLDDLTFKRLPEIGPAPDMISDDLPTNMDYLDESFGTAAGLRELRDDDLDEFDADDVQSSAPPIVHGGAGVISRVGGETIKMLRPEGIQIVEHYFDNLPPDSNPAVESGATTLQVCIHKSDVVFLLYDGYDWSKTRKTIENEINEMRRRLTKIRQLVASGQAQDPNIEETSALLFNSLYIGLDQDIEGLEPGAIIAAIDQELKDDVELASQSSWQSLKSPPAKAHNRTVRIHGKRLTRSKRPSMEFRLMGLEGEVDHYRPNEPMVSRILATIRDVEILDHIKSSTWKKFLTELRSDSRGNIRETESNMVRVELCHIHPVPGHPSEEARLRAKILPLRLYVDQDAVDFLKRFFSFKDPHASVSEIDTEEIYFQSAEVFPVDLKLDYKPRRVDYRALREGRTIELMNFFHFDGAEMTLRHITLSGITGWPRLFELLNDLWTPDVKATQLVEVISGVAPIRSVVNVGSGMADLVLLPIAQYKKDGRIVRGIQKGTTAFVKSTAVEAIKLGARLATGTQVILEQAEGVLGSQFRQSITTEAVHTHSRDGFPQDNLDLNDGDDESAGISKYAQQPNDIKEGVQSAYKSLQKNFNSAAQTILAVPMEVYERSGNEGPVRSVVRAVPIAVLRPMIGASEAVSKTLLGLHNTLDPDLRHDNEAKYKRP